MAKDPRQNRVPIMFSDEEIQTIDDWRFENRVATRSDAVRRLAKTGVHSHQNIMAMISDVSANLNKLSSALQTVSKELKAHLPENEDDIMWGDHSPFVSSALVVIKAMEPAIEMQASFLARLRALVETTRVLRHVPETDAAIASAQAIQTEAEQLIEKLEQKGRPK